MQQMHESDTAAPVAVPEELSQSLLEKEDPRTVSRSQIFFLILLFLACT